MLEHKTHKCYVQVWVYKGSCLVDVYSSVEVGSDLGVHQIFGRPSQSGSAFTVIHVNITSVHCIVGSDPGVHQIFGRPSQSGSAFTVILYNYHHSTKLYRKISRVCCRLYCYECAARVTMPTATNE